MKAAQSITVSRSSENDGRSEAEIWERIEIVIGRRIRCFVPADRFMPFKIRRS